MEKAKIKRESKRKIRVDFERAPLKERLKTKFLNTFFLKKVLFLIFKLVLLVGVSYIILYPYITKIFTSFMSPSDFEDATVVLISKNPTWNQYKYIITENQYGKAVLTTLLLSGSVALIQTLVCALIAYGLAKFKFKGNNLVFLIAILTMMIPFGMLRFPIMRYFTRFHESNPIGWLLFKLGVIEKGQFLNTIWPLYIMSITGLGLKNGLFIFMLRQFFKGVPDELEESAYVDGSSTFRTFFRIIIPISIPMLITVFVFAFAWQWTDDFFTTKEMTIFFQPTYWQREDSMKLISHIATVPPSLTTRDTKYQTAIYGTASILIVLPLMLVYLIAQNKIVEGVERSGIVG